MSEGEWKTIRRGRKGKRHRGVPNRLKPAAYHVSAPLAPDPSLSKINVHHVMNVASSLRQTVWWQQTAAYILQATSIHTGSEATMYCLGMGSFALWNNSTHQLACACLLRELLQVRKCFVGDPVMNDADERVLEQLHMTRKEWQPTEDLLVEDGTFLFMVLPHCSREINEQVLRTLNRCDALDKVVFLANQLSLYWERLPTLSADYDGFIAELHKSGRLEEKACPCSKVSSSETAFNDLCVLRVLPDGRARSEGSLKNKTE